MTRMFRDRTDAGRQLATRLLPYKDQHPVVLALPRGGVPVAYEIALALNAPLDVLVVRKLGAPDEPELGIGAVVDGEHPLRVLNNDLIRSLGISDAYIEREVALEVEEVRRRQRRYRAGRQPVSIADATVILVDDGIATGSSIRAAVRSLRQAAIRSLVLAVPVAPPDTVDSLRAEVNDLVCVSTPPLFHSVGQFYEDFRQTTDEEVIELLGLRTEDYLST